MTTVAEEIENKHLTLEQGFIPLRNLKTIERPKGKKTGSGAETLILKRRGTGGVPKGL